MRADGTLKNGVHDVNPAGMKIHVVAAFEDGRLVLRPEGLPIEVIRYLEDDRMVWHYGPTVTVWMERVG